VSSACSGWPVRPESSDIDGRHRGGARRGDRHRRRRVASLGAVIPYTVVKTSGFLPTTWPWLFPAVGVAAVVLTVGTSLVASRRVVRTPAVEAVAA